jgi:DNA-directed RNA polymerase subunit M/transcription elongation factor TFIIS
MLTDYLENQIKKKIEAAAPLYTVEDDFPKTQSWMDSVMKRIKCIVSKHEIQAIIDEYCYYTPVEDMIQGKNVHQNPELVFVYHELAKQSEHMNQWGKPQEQDPEMKEERQMKYVIQDPDVTFGLKLQAEICPKCHQDQTSAHKINKRSLDEPDQFEYVCNNLQCGFSWKKRS